MLSFEATRERDELAASVTTLLGRHDLRPATPSPALWAALGDVGVLGLGSRLVGGTAGDLVAALRAVGTAGACGPFLGAVLAARAADDELAGAAAAGSTLVGVVEGTVAAWGAVADVLVEVAGDGSLWLVEPDGVLAPLATLAGEPWARGRFRRTRPLGPAGGSAVVHAELARAAWVVGAAEALVASAADHARQRRQFGRPIGDFQAVAHQLAASAADVGAAADLVVLAAWRATHDGDRALADAARLASTRAGLGAAYASHQAHGALGFTVERGLHRWSTGIRQMSLHPPAPAAGARP